MQLEKAKKKKTSARIQILQIPFQQECQGFF